MVTSFLGKQRIEWTEEWVGTWYLSFWTAPVTPFIRIDALYAYIVLGYICTYLLLFFFVVILTYYSIYSTSLNIKVYSFYTSRNTKHFFPRNRRQLDWGNKDHFFPLPYGYIHQKLPFIVCDCQYLKKL